MARTHTFKGSASAGYGYFAYIEDGQLVIGEDWGREGGILYRGTYRYADYWLKVLNKKAPKLCNSILQWYANEARKQAETVGVTHVFKDSCDSHGNGYSGCVKDGLLVLEYDDPRNGGCYFRGSYEEAVAKGHIAELKREDKVLYDDIEKYFTKHVVNDESDRKDLGGSKETKYTVRLFLNNSKEIVAVMTGTSETEVIRKIMLPVPDTVMMYDLEGRAMAVRSDKIYTVTILD